MNYKTNEQNPIEMIRLSEQKNQADFAQKLGFEDKSQYSYHMRNFTPDIIEKINALYDRDLSNEIINHLKFKIRKLKKQIKDSSKINKNDKIANNPSNNQISDLINRVG